MENKKHRINVSVRRFNATELASPISGIMEGRISESMTSELELKLTDLRSGKTIYEDTGRNVALEVAGEIQEIMTENTSM